MRLTITHIFLSLTMMLACKRENRFEDDPRGSMTNPHKRLMGGWKLVDYTFEGQSVMDDLANFTKPPANPSHYMIGYTEQSHLYSLEIKHDGCCAQYGGEFDGKFIRIPAGTRDSSFIVWYYSPFQYDTSRFGSVTFWKVTKLFEKDLHLTLHTDSGSFKMIYRHY